MQTAQRAFLLGKRAVVLNKHRVYTERFELFIVIGFIKPASVIAKNVRNNELDFRNESLSDFHNIKQTFHKKSNTAG